MNADASSEVLTFIGLGANLGDARQTVRQALLDLAQLPNCRLLRASSLYRSAPLQASGDAFINAVAALGTRLSATQLLDALHSMEQARGRLRPYRNAPRTLDLDILLYGTAHINQPGLHIPHPRMHQRAFVLLPLAEIAPHQVSTEQLATTSWQEIERLE